MKIKKYVENLQDDLTRAWLNYQIYWFYRNKDTRPIYVDVMNIYSFFFETSIHAHFAAMIIELYRIHENRSDTYNLPKLIAKLKKKEDFPKEILDKVKFLYSEAKPLWKKVVILRNNCVGHVSNKLDTSGYFKKASVKPKELKHLIELTRKCLNEVQMFIDRSARHNDYSSERDIKQLLEDLKEYHGHKNTIKT